MGKTYETAFELDAKLGKRFGSTMTRAEKALAALGKTAAGLKKADAATRTFQRLERQVESGEAALRAARAEVKRLGSALLGAEHPTDAMKESFRQAEREANRLEQALAKDRRALDKVGQELRDAGVDTRRLGAEQQRLRTQFDRTARKMKGLALIADSKLGKSLGNLGRELRGIGTAAAGLAVAGLYKIGKETMSVEQATAKFATLESVTAEQIAATHQAAIKWTNKHGGSVEGYLGGAYTAVSSTITDTNAAIAATEQSAKLAKATLGDQSVAMKVLGSLYVNVGDKAKPANEELERLSDILAKTQQEAKIEDLSQLGEGLKDGLPAAQAYGVKLEQIAAIIGTLNTSGIEGSRAGTGARSALAQLPKAAERIRKKYDKSFRIVKDDKGGFDLLASIQAMEPALAKAAKQGKTAGEVLTEAFGTEAMGTVSALRTNLAAAMDLQSRMSGVEGATERAFGAYAGLEKYEAIQSQINNNFAEMGRRLLPLVEKKLPDIERLISKMPAVFEALFDAGAKIWSVIDSLGGVKTILYSIAAVKLVSIGKALLDVAGGVWKLGTGIWALAGPGSGGISKLSEAAGKLGAVGGPVAAATVAIAAWGTAVYYAKRSYEEWQDLQTAKETNRRIDAATGGLLGKQAEKAGTARTTGPAEIQAAHNALQGAVEVGRKLAIRREAKERGLDATGGITAVTSRLRAAGVGSTSGGIKIDFRPEFHVQGSADQKDLARMTQVLKGDLLAVVDKAMADGRRRSYQ